MRAAILGLLLFIVTGAAIVCSGETEATWKTFTNQAGWSLQYPPDWSVETCEACPDPTAPQVYVNFFPPDELEAEGSVMVEPLPDKPADVSADAWLKQLPARGNHNPLRGETRITLHGSPALRVRYRTASGDDKEAVYVVSGSRTYEIEFSTEQPRVPLERLANYDDFQKMVDTFQVTSSE